MITEAQIIEFFSKPLHLPPDVSADDRLEEALSEKYSLVRYGLTLLNFMETHGLTPPHQPLEEFLVFPTLQSVITFAKENKIVSK